MNVPPQFQGVPLPLEMMAREINARYLHIKS